MRPELAWAAGFFDGEGWVGPHRGRCRLEIDQTDRFVLDRFRDAVGVGRVYGPYARANRPNSRPTFKYQASGDDVFLIAELLLPLLSPIKAEQLSAGLFHEQVAA